MDGKLIIVAKAGVFTHLEISELHLFCETSNETDEYVEVTPESIRLRKVLLNEHDRKRASK